MQAEIGTRPFPQCCAVFVTQGLFHTQAVLVANVVHQHTPCNICIEQDSNTDPDPACQVFRMRRHRGHDVTAS